MNILHAVKYALEKYFEITVAPDNHYSFPGNEFKDQIENYSLKYRPDLGCFIFRNKRYSTLKEFVADPEYNGILKKAVPKTMDMMNPESKYRCDAEFLISSVRAMTI